MTERELLATIAGNIAGHLRGEVLDEKEYTLEDTEFIAEEAVTLARHIVAQVNVVPNAPENVLKNHLTHAIIVAERRGDALENEGVPLNNMNEATLAAARAALRGEKETPKEPPKECPHNSIEPVCAGCAIEWREGE